MNPEPNGEITSTWIWIFETGLLRRRWEWHAYKVIAGWWDVAVGSGRHLSKRLARTAAENCLRDAGLRVPFRTSPPQLSTIGRKRPSGVAG